MSFLRLDNVTAFYGASQALFGVSLDVDEGEAVALMGRNGMGKTTTIRVIMQLVAARSGTVSFDHVTLNGRAAHAVARLGLGLVPEGRRCFAGLTVVENLTAAARPGPWDVDSVTGLFPRLAERRDQSAAQLSGGEQQMLAIGRALMTNPRMLLLDEATEGLAPVVRQEIWAAITRLKTEQGLSLLVVDKSLAELRAVVDRAVILERGRDVWSGEMATLDAAVAHRYLGV